MFPYILKLEISGIKCIKNKISLEFYKDTLSKNFQPSGYRVKAIYGGNGVGKSAIITAVLIMKNLILSRGYLSESRNQEFLNEMINKETKELKISCEFVSDLPHGIHTCRYSITLSEDENQKCVIKHEKFSEKSIYGHYNDIYETENGRLIFIKYQADRDFFAQKTMNLLGDNSFVNICALGTDVPEQMRLELLPLIVMAFVLYVYVDNEDRHVTYLQRMELMRMQKEGLGAKSDLLKKMTEIVSADQRYVLKEQFSDYEELIKKLTAFIRLFKPTLKQIDIEKKENGNFYNCDLNFNYGNYSVNREFESTGIKKLVRIFDVLNDGASGGIAFIDEMDANLNDVYLRAIVEYFEVYGKGQLCFTSHDTEPMGVLKKYKKSIDFLSNDNHLVPWVKNGNSSPANAYKNGLIKYLPFNIDATDFIGILGD